MDREQFSAASLANAAHTHPEDPHPHACTDGYVYLGYVATDEETGEEVECIEALPCRRCAEETAKT